MPLIAGFGMLIHTKSRRTINFVMELKLSYGIPLERPFFLDNQMCNIEICHDAISKIAKHFNVSFIAAKKRMIHDKLLVEKTIFQL